MASKYQPKQCCLIVIDGWGESKVEKGNAILNAQTPVMTSLTKNYPSTSLAAHGHAVGLPDGLMGNSEVGHLNIGAGRVVYQDIVRIDLAVKNHKLHTLPAVSDALKAAKAKNSIHFVGLVSDGGVHSHQTHLYEFLEKAKEAGIKNAYVHFIADGRDTSPKSALGYCESLIGVFKKLDYGSIATICGRYYAMDRDKRWERIKLAYDAFTQGTGQTCSDFLKAIQERYDADETDEFLKPILPEDYASSRIKDDDAVICFNYRSDRMREICQALGIAPLPFDGVPVKPVITTMTRYKADFPFPNIFPPQTMDNVLAEWLSKKKIRQCHVAETEKIAHVTFFFNGDLEERDLIDSPKVATYDLKPEMSAIQVAEKVAERVCSKEFPLVLCNFAPPDMVGHTGKYEAALTAIEATDKAIGIIYEACKKTDTVLFVTADHGNAEKMLSDDFSTPHTAHTCARVPFIVASEDYEFKEGYDGGLCDVAPSLLEVMGIEPPPEMTGQSLLKRL